MHSDMHSCINDENFISSHSVTMIETTGSPHNSLGAGGWPGSSPYSLLSCPCCLAEMDASERSTGPMSIFDFSSHLPPWATTLADLRVS
jgi:hypothetical protein